MSTEQEIKDILVDFYRQARDGDYLDSLNLTIKKFAAMMGGVVSLKDDSVYRAALLHGSDQLGTYGNGHRQECERIKRLLREQGYVHAGLSDALELWGRYSDGAAAGWLSLPEDDSDVILCLNPYIN